MISPYHKFLAFCCALFLAANAWAQPSSNSPVCEKETILLKANLTASSYQWSGPNGFTSTQPEPSLTAELVSAGTYQLTVVINGNSQSYSTDVVVNQAPQAPEVNNFASCAGDILNIVPNNNDPGLIYTWTLPGGGTEVGVPLNVNTTGGNGAGNYTVVATNPNCSSPSESFSIAVFTRPGLATVNGELNVCEGEPLNLNASNTGGNTVTWILPNQTTTSGVNLFKGGMQAGDAGTYGVKLSNPGCEGNIRNFNVNVYKAPTGFSINAGFLTCPPA